MFCLFQVKKLKAQLEQKAQKNGSDSRSSPDGEIIENGNDPNITDFQRRCTQVEKQPRRVERVKRLTSLLLQNVLRRLQQASERPEVQTGQGGTGSHGFRAERERRRFLQSSLCSFNFASVSSCVSVNAGDPARRSGDALQICSRERRESGGRAEGRETQAAERGRKFYDFSTSCAHGLHLTLLFFSFSSFDPSAAIGAG